jgi:hypothetical protein
VWRQDLRVSEQEEIGRGFTDDCFPFHSLVMVLHTDDDLDLPDTKINATHPP